jgi:hypothetical protein
MPGTLVSKSSSIFKAEVLAHRHFESLAQAQDEFDRWRWVYHRERPHEALSMQPPAQCYSPSPRDWPASLPPIEYGPDDHVRQVQQGGWISFRGRHIRISKALVGQPVALRPCLEAEGLFKIYFCHQLLLTLDRREYDVI